MPAFGRAGGQGVGFAMRGAADIIYLRAKALRGRSGRSSVVEHLLPKQRVVGSSPIARSRYDFGWSETLV